MARSRKFLIGIAIGIGITAYAFVVILARTSEGTQVKLTILIEDPILTDGGTVILMPRAIPAGEHIDDQLTVEVAETLSFVYFDYPENTRWAILFDRKPEDTYRARSTKFKSVSIGSADYFDEKGEKISIESYDILHVTGRLVSETDSHTIGLYFTDYLAKGVSCKEYGQHAKVCISNRPIQ